MNEQDNEQDEGMITMNREDLLGKHYEITTLGEAIIKEDLFDVVAKFYNNKDTEGMTVSDMREIVEDLYMILELSAIDVNDLTDEFDEDEDCQPCEMVEVQAVDDLREDVEVELNKVKKDITEINETLEAVVKLFQAHDKRIKRLHNKDKGEW